MEKKEKLKISDLFYDNRFLLVFSLLTAVVIWLVVAVVLAAMVGCSMLAVKFSSICCILLCGAAGVLTYAVGQMKKKGGTK